MKFVTTPPHDEDCQVVSHDVLQVVQKKDVFGSSGHVCNPSGRVSQHSPRDAQVHLAPSSVRPPAAHSNAIVPRHWGRGAVLNNNVQDGHVNLA